jgi:predicted enzyme related to lactoylglutathione lyase
MSGTRGIIRFRQDPRTGWMRLLLYAAIVTFPQAVELGTKVIIPPTVLPEGDQMAVLHDPQGMALGIWQPAPASR